MKTYMICIQAEHFMKIEARDEDHAVELAFERVEAGEVEYEVTVQSAEGEE
jgi:hypothetical protein